jgi:hypothetical protein
MNGMRKAQIFPDFLIILAPFILFAPVYALGKALFWGTPLLQFVPWWSYAWENVLAGNLPLWNSQLGMGAPLVANYQSALFYPPHWIYFLLYVMGDVPLIAWGQAVLVAFHLVWAGIGMAYVIRRLGLSPLSQCISALAFCLSGYMVARAGFLSINAAVAWLPWIIAYLTPIKDSWKFSVRNYLFLVFCVAMQLLAGHAQTTFYSLVLAGIWAAYWAWDGAIVLNLDRKQADIGTRRQTLWGSLAARLVTNWGWLAVGLLFAVGLASVQLLPTVEYLAQSQRAASADYDFVVTYSFWPWRLVTLLAPDMFGSPVDGDYWGYANYWEDAIYIGLLPFLLALGAVLSSLRRKNWHPKLGTHTNLPAMKMHFSWFLLAIFLLALLLALGKNTPIFPWLYYHVPTFDMFQAPTRFMIWGVFSLAILAGVGVQRWRRPEGRGLYWTRLGTMGAFAITFGSGLAWIAMGDISPSFIRATALAGFWGVGAGLLSLTAPKEQSQISSQNDTAQDPSIWHWTVGVFVALDLLVAGWGLNPGIELDIYMASPNASLVRSETNGQRLFISEEGERELKFERFLRFDTFDPGEDWQALRETYLPNQNLLDGISSANNFDPLVPGRYARWIAFLSDVDLSYRERLLNLMDVGVLQEVDPTQSNGLRFTSVDGSQRVRWADCAYNVMDAEQAWELIEAVQIDFEQQVVIETGDENQSGDCLGSHKADVSIERESPGEVKIHVNNSSNGWLVLSDTWYPGWQASLDGEEAEILRANYLFRAVAVPEGEHWVTMKYRPATFIFGCILSLITIGIYVGLWLWVSRKNLRNESET